VGQPPHARRAVGAAPARVGLAVVLKPLLVRRSSHRLLSTAGLASLAILAVSPRPANAQTSDTERQATPAHFAPGDSLRLLTDLALSHNRLADYDALLERIDRALRATPSDSVLRHYRGFALYRKASLAAATGGDAKAIKAMFEEADRELEGSAEHLSWPEAPALRSAVVGQLIEYGGALSGMRLGTRSLRLIDDAFIAGPDNPRVAMLRGISLMHRPALMGGGLDKAEAELQRALDLFAADSAPAPRPWWGHAEALGWLGQVYARQGRVADARATYGRALALDPANAWVRELLLPALDSLAR